MSNNRDVLRRLIRRHRARKTVAAFGVSRRFCAMHGSWPAAVAALVVPRRFYAMHRSWPAAVAFSVLLAGCSLFSTRSPESPLTEGGTFSQPDTPEQVIDNLIESIAELNTLNYRRSLSSDLVFHPTATAESRESVFVNWGRAQEEQYFSALAAAASSNPGHQLSLNDKSFTILSGTEYVLDATYVLTVNHRRPDAPSEVQGRMQWLIRQLSGGLWEVAEWTDQELGNSPSWSDLKAEFMK